MISVCLATYNGEKYIKEQIDSILSQLSEKDELIISDDGSTDSTKDILAFYNDSRIKIFSNTNRKGIVGNFENALLHSTGDYVFLSDQDDIWVSNRVADMIQAIKQNDSLLLSSLFVCFEKGINNLKPQYDNYFKPNSSLNYCSNISNVIVGKRIYFGCTMLINRNLLSVVLPIPKYVDCHDLWIVLVANICKSNYHFNQPTLYRRIHQNNASTRHRPLIKKLRTRFFHIVSLLVILHRISYRNK
jgi:glycosyltransferase involved in cell wall biosynthesis